MENELEPRSTAGPARSNSSRSRLNFRCIANARSGINDRDSFKVKEQPGLAVFRQKRWARRAPRRGLLLLPRRAKKVEGPPVRFTSCSSIDHLCTSLVAAPLLPWALPRLVVVVVVLLLLWTSITASVRKRIGKGVRETCRCRLLGFGGSGLLCQLLYWRRKVGRFLEEGEEG